MSKWIRFIVVLLAACSLFGLTANAASGSGSVSEITIKVEEEEPGRYDRCYNAYFTKDSNRYDITDISWSTQYEAWQPGVPVTAYLRLVPNSGYTMREPVVKVKGDRLSVKAVSSGGSYLDVQLEYYPKMQLDAPYDVWVDGYTARWNAVPYAREYDVNVYRDGKLYKELFTESTEISIAAYCTDEAVYSVKVRAAGDKNGRKASDWSYESSVAYRGHRTPSGKWEKSNGVLRFKIENQKGPGVTPQGYLCDGWHQLNGEWFYFDASGAAAYSTWKNIGNQWFYFNFQGAMQSGWQQLDGKWYFLNTNHDGNYGAMMTGWVSVGGVWYYFDLATGAMLANQYTPDGFYVGPNGAWIA